MIPQLSFLNVKLIGMYNSTWFSLTQNQAFCLMAIILGFRRLRWENWCELEASMGHRVWCCIKSKKENWKLFNRNTGLLRAELFIITMMWNPWRWPSMQELIKKTWDICAMKYFSVSEKKDILLYVTILMESKDILRWNKADTEKQMLCIFLYIFPFHACFWDYNIITSPPSLYFLQTLPETLLSHHQIHNLFFYLLVEALKVSFLEAESKRMTTGVQEGEKLGREG